MLTIREGGTVQRQVLYGSHLFKDDSTVTHCVQVYYNDFDEDKKDLFKKLKCFNKSNTIYSMVYVRTNCILS